MIIHQIGNKELNWKQITKINRTYSSRLEIVSGVPQDSILCPLLFRIFLEDLFFILNDVGIAIYANNNTPHVVADEINGVMASLGKVSEALFVWFENNLLKSNADKYNLLLSSSDAVSLRVSEYDIRNSECENFLGLKFDISQHLKNISLIFVEKLVKNLCTSKNRSILGLMSMTHGHEYFIQFAVQLLFTDLDVSQSHDN